VLIDPVADDDAFAEALGHAMESMLDDQFRGARARDARELGGHYSIDLMADEYATLINGIIDKQATDFSS
jgi:hypothetical protein